MLAHRLRRWHNIKTTLGQCFVDVLAGAGLPRKPGVAYNGPFPLVRYPRGCHIIQPSLNPCIISIHAEPARVIFRSGRESNNVRFFPHRMAKTHGEFQKITSHRWVFPCIAAWFSKFVRINLTWTYNLLIICKYGKRNPIFNTIKDGQEMCGRKFLRN